MILLPFEIFGILVLCFFVFCFLKLMFMNGFLLLEKFFNWADDSPKSPPPPPKPYFRSELDDDF